MLDNLLFADYRVVNTDLKMGLFSRETASRLETTNPSDTGSHQKNYDLNKRWNMSKESKEVELIGRLHFDLFECNRYLLSAVQIQIKLRHAPDSFRLLCDVTDQDYKVEITSAFLQVPMLELAPGVALAHDEAMSLRPSLYP